MAHKYIDDLLGNNRYSETIFSEDTLKNQDYRNDEFTEQINTYGFSEVETQGLDQTMDALLYERLKMYYEKASQVINLDYYKFDIPVLYPTEQTEPKYTTKNHWYEVKTENHTMKECILLMIEYLADELKGSTLNMTTHTIVEVEKAEQQGYEKACTAWDIFAILRRAGVLWW